jgi:hypothetical protein
LDRYFSFSKPVGYPLLLATAAIAILSNISAIERLWTIGRAMREREAAAQLQELAEVAQEHGDVVLVSEEDEDLAHL